MSTLDPPDPDIDRHEKLATYEAAEKFAALAAAVEQVAFDEMKRDAGTGPSWFRRGIDGLRRPRLSGDRS